MTTKQNVKLSWCLCFKKLKEKEKIMANSEENAMEELNDEQLAEVTGGWGGESSRSRFGLGLGLDISGSSSYSEGY